MSCITYSHYFYFHFVPSKRCEEVHYFLFDSRGAKVLKKMSLPLLIWITYIEEYFFKNEGVNGDGFVERDWDREFGETNEYIDVLTDNVDVLSMRNSNEYTHPKFDAKVHMENLIFKLGMCLSNAEKFKESIENYVIKNGRWENIP